jgi:hypothetical protein
MGSQGGSSRERSAGARTNDAATRLGRTLPGSHEVQRRLWRRWSRTAKLCGPGAPMLASSFSEMHPPNRVGCIKDPRSDGGKKAGHRGERKVSRNPSRRESRFDPVEPVVTSCASCAHDRGCNRHPAFPAPSVLGGGWRSKPRALGAAGNADPHPQDEATRGRRVEGVGWRCRIDTFVASRPQFLNI